MRSRHRLPSWQLTTERISGYLMNSGTAALSQGTRSEARSCRGNLPPFPLVGGRVPEPDASPPDPEATVSKATAFQKSNRSLTPKTCAEAETSHDISKDPATATLKSLPAAPPQAATPDLTTLPTSSNSTPRQGWCSQHGQFLTHQLEDAVVNYLEDSKGRHGNNDERFEELLFSTRLREVMSIVTDAVVEAKRYVHQLCLKRRRSPFFTRKQNFLGAAARNVDFWSSSDDNVSVLDESARSCAYADSVCGSASGGVGPPGDKSTYSRRIVEATVQLFMHASLEAASSTPQRFSPLRKRSRRPRRPQARCTDCGQDFPRFGRPLRRHRERFGGERRGRHLTKAIAHQERNRPTASRHWSASPEKRRLCRSKMLNVSSQATEQLVTQQVQTCFSPVPRTLSRFEGTPLNKAGCRFSCLQKSAVHLPPVEFSSQFAQTSPRCRLGAVKLQHVQLTVAPAPRDSVTQTFVEDQSHKAFRRLQTSKPLFLTSQTRDADAQVTLQILGKEVDLQVECPKLERASAQVELEGPKCAGAMLAEDLRAGILRTNRRYNAILEEVERFTEGLLAEAAAAGVAEFQDDVWAVIKSGKLSEEVWRMRRLVDLAQSRFESLRLNFEDQETELRRRVLWASAEEEKIRENKFRLLETRRDLDERRQVSDQQHADLRAKLQELEKDQQTLEARESEAVSQNELLQRRRREAKERKGELERDQCKLMEQQSRLEKEKGEARALEERVNELKLKVKVAEGQVDQATLLVKAEEEALRLKEQTLVGRRGAIEDKLRRLALSSTEMHMRLQRLTMWEADEESASLRAHLKCRLATELIAARKAETEAARQQSALSLEHLMEEKVALEQLNAELSLAIEKTRQEQAVLAAKRASVDVARKEEELQRSKQQHDLHRQHLALEDLRSRISSARKAYERQKAELEAQSAQQKAKVMREEKSAVQDLALQRKCLEDLRCLAASTRATYSAQCEEIKRSIEAEEERMSVMNKREKEMLRLHEEDFISHLLRARRKREDTRRLELSYKAKYQSEARALQESIRQCMEKYRKTTEECSKELALGRSRLERTAMGSEDACFRYLEETTRLLSRSAVLRNLEAKIVEANRHTKLKMTLVNERQLALRRRQEEALLQSAELEAILTLQAQKMSQLGERLAANMEAFRAISEEAGCLSGVEGKSDLPDLQKLGGAPEGGRAVGDLTIRSRSSGLIRPKEQMLWRRSLSAHRLVDGVCGRQDGKHNNRSPWLPIGKLVVEDYPKTGHCQDLPNRTGESWQTTVCHLGESARASFTGRAKSAAVTDAEMRAFSSEVQCLRRSDVKRETRNLLHQDKLTLEQITARCFDATPSSCESMGNEPPSRLNKLGRDGKERSPEGTEETILASQPAPALTFTAEELMFNRQFHRRLGPGSDEGAPLTQPPRIKPIPTKDEIAGKLSNSRASNLYCSFDSNSNKHSNNNNNKHSNNNNNNNNSKRDWVPQSSLFEGSYNTPATLPTTMGSNGSTSSCSDSPFAQQGPMCMRLHTMKTPPDSRFLPKTTPTQATRAQSRPKLSAQCQSETDSSLKKRERSAEQEKPLAGKQSQLKRPVLLVREGYTQPLLHHRRGEKPLIQRALVVGCSHMRRTQVLQEGSMCPRAHVGPMSADNYLKGVVPTSYLSEEFCVSVPVKFADAEMPSLSAVPNDVIMWLDYLLNDLGWDAESIAVLSDDLDSLRKFQTKQNFGLSSHKNGYKGFSKTALPTKKNILRRLEWLVRPASSTSTAAAMELLFVFCGYGTNSITASVGPIMPNTRRETAELGIAPSKAACHTHGHGRAVHPPPPTKITAQEVNRGQQQGAGAIPLFIAWRQNACIPYDFANVTYMRATAAPATRSAVAKTEERDFVWQLVSLNEILSVFTELPESAKVVLALDCCHSDVLEDDTLNTKPSTDSSSSSSTSVYTSDRCVVNPMVSQAVEVVFGDPLDAIGRNHNTSNENFLACEGAMRRRVGQPTEPLTQQQEKFLRGRHRRESERGRGVQVFGARARCLQLLAGRSRPPEPSQDPPVLSRLACSLVVCSATREGYAAYEGTMNQESHGIFTSTLLKWLRSSGEAEAEGVQSLYRAVSSMEFVTATERRLMQRQLPVIRTLQLKRT